MKKWRRVLAILFTFPGLFILAGSGEAAFGQDEHAGHTLSTDFGKVHFESSCSPAAQQEFDRAVAMLHSFFYPETEKAFQGVAEREPSCAMAYWGIAISQRPNPLTAPFPPQLLKQGWDAIQKARAAAPPTQRERDWIEALVVFFQNYDTVDQRTRTARYEMAMERLHLRYANDNEAAAFYALALLEAVDLMDKTYSKQLKAAGILERLQKTKPEHPGVVHYLIHSYDYAPIAAKGLPAARRYAALAPSAPHALHMPSHIFSTLGMWHDAIRSNLAADAANRAYAASTNPSAAANPAAITARYHNLDFLTNAYLQLAQDQRAKAVLDERNSIGALAPGAGMTSQTGFAAMAVRYAIERGSWDEAAKLSPMSTPFKQADAIIWFGRALGAARLGDIAGSKQNLSQISRLRQELASAGDPYWAEQVGIQETAASAWIALGNNNVSQAIALMQDAADREDRSEKHIAMENRLSPMRELLGELLLSADKPREALKEFERSLRIVPNRFRSLAGAGQAAAKTGNQRLAQSYFKQLLSQAANADSERPALEAARTFMRQRP
jgi:tetratricopeptide (TPR) repeat protein